MLGAGFPQTFSKDFHYTFFWERLRVREGFRVQGQMVQLRFFGFASG